MLLNQKFLMPCYGLCMLVAALSAQAETRVEMDPVAPGPYQVSCSNLAHDIGKLNLLGGSVVDYWSGRDGRYVSDILLEPDDTLKASPLVPNEGLYPRRRNSTVDFTILACYPTDETNLSPDYVLPDGQIIPRMQRAGQPPIVAGRACIAAFPAPPGCTRWPLLAFSHGLGSSPADDKSIEFLVRLASYGYIVAAPFHGDARFLRLDLSDIGDLIYLIRNFDEFVELQALRPLAMKSVIDAMLEHPGFGSKIDQDRIGGIGASLGGETMILLLGAHLTKSYSNYSSTPTVTDPRIKAAVGYAPYAGQKYLPAFGDENVTAGYVSTPYLAISGTADSVSPMHRIIEAVSRFRGTHYLVALSDIGHTYEAAYADDVFGWVVPFFAAYLGGVDPGYASQGQLMQQLNIRGGLDDYLLIAHDAPPPHSVEFYHAGIDHYFMTASAGEAAFLDNNPGWGWSRTGKTFNVWLTQSSAPGGASPVCRFYGVFANGTQGSHFYTADPDECAYVKGRLEWGWGYEGVAFYAVLPAGGSCQSGAPPIYRVYNNGMGGAPNHRYLASQADVNAMVAQGWVPEGVAFCGAQ